MSLQCPNNCISEWNGVCDTSTGICSCSRLFRPGPLGDCSLQVIQITPGFAGFFWFYDAFTSLLFLILFVISLYCIYRSILHMIRKKIKLDLPSPLNIFIMDSIGILLRLLMLLIDPMNIREIFSVDGFDLMLSLPLVFWAEAGYLLFIFWLDIALKVKELRTTKLVWLRIPLIVAFFVTFAVITAVTFNDAFSNARSSLINYNVTLTVILAIFIIFIFAFGGKLYFTLKSLPIQQKGKQAFLNRTIKIMFSLSVTIIIAAILLACHIIFFNNAWAWIIIHFLLRCVEAIGAIQFMWVVYPKSSPKKPSQDRSTSNVTTKDSKGSQVELKSGNQNSLWVESSQDLNASLQETNSNPNQESFTLQKDSSSTQLELRTDENPTQLQTSQELNSEATTTEPNERTVNS